MPPADENGREPACSDHTGGDDLSFKEQELLAKARDVARRITARVRKALEDTDVHQPLPPKKRSRPSPEPRAADSRLLPAGVEFVTVGVPSAVRVRWRLDEQLHHLSTAPRPAVPRVANLIGGSAFVRPRAQFAPENGHLFRGVRVRRLRVRGHHHILTGDTIPKTIPRQLCGHFITLLDLSVPSDKGSTRHPPHRDRDFIACNEFGQSSDFPPGARYLVECARKTAAVLLRSQSRITPTRGHSE